jgi:hypothetical protein
VIIQIMHSSHSSDKSTTKIIKNKRGGALLIKNKDWVDQKVKRTLGRSSAPPSCVTQRGMGTRWEGRQEGQTQLISSRHVGRRDASLSSYSRNGMLPFAR